jgi:hypothetical protein
VVMDDQDPFRDEMHTAAAVAWYGPLPDGHEVEAETASAAASAARSSKPVAVLRTGGPAGSVRLTAVVARRVCERVEMGESLRGICADPDMPHRGTVRAWCKRHPVFALKLEQARAAAGWHFLGGQKPLWCPQLAREVCARVAAGEALSHVCADAEMPSLGVVYRWRANRPEFAAAMRLAREVRAERLCDQGWDIACQVTPENAYATRVQLAQLRWMTAFLAPRRFGRVKPMEAEVAVETAATQPGKVPPSAWLVKQYRVEERADGAQRMVAFVPDPRTNRVVRVTPHDAPWGRPPIGNFKTNKYVLPMEGNEG